MVGEEPGERPGGGAWPRERRTLVVDEVDSPDSIPAPYALLSESVRAGVPLEFEPHTHRLHELVWVRGGTMTVRLPDRVVTVPDGYGIWMPAGTVHSGRTTARAHLYDALFEPARSPAVSPESMVVEVTPLLGALLTHLQIDGLAQGERLRAEAVVFDLLASAERSFDLRVPRAERVGPIVTALLDDPTDRRTLREWSALVGVSERSVARLFRTHTGLTFSQWRQALVIHHALSLLAEGLAVQDVSDLCGFAQPSTFIAAFKRVMGTTPGAYVADRES
ncbi:AraC family transcriptional regulator [Microbacterium sp. cf332]|uniref:helix-turn-helix domain-containing protein n=1 Tax=Microbacterium sp. cf332 TaxID=1761804 RepID=UPI0008868B91|nr:AraC family transcriptional regulator [Microbacterium sp. cf332]SDQ94470.1 AraC-type DNA-binding protein [Microbacterium sp. cf332]